MIGTGCDTGGLFVGQSLRWVVMGSDLGEDTPADVPAYGRWDLHLHDKIKNII